MRNDALDGGFDGPWDDSEVHWLPRKGERAPNRPARAVAARQAPIAAARRATDGGTKAPVLARAFLVCGAMSALGVMALSRTDGPLAPVRSAQASVPGEVVASLGSAGRFGPQRASAASASALPPSAAAASAAALVLASLPSAVADAAVPEVSREELRRVLAPAEARDPDELLTFGPMRIRRWLVENIVKAAALTRSDPVLLMAIADKESSFSTKVKAATSSAEGLFQFIEQTWLKVVRQYGERHGLADEAALIVPSDDGFVVADPADRTRILERRRDPYLSALMAAEMLKGDSDRIARRIGRDLTHGEVYIAHFLGPQDAEEFLAKVVGSPKAVAAKLLPRPARANRPIFFAGRGRKAKGLSVAEVHRKFEDMMGLRTDRYRSVPQVAGVLAYASAEPLQAQ